MSDQSDSLRIPMAVRESLRCPKCGSAVTIESAVTCSNDRSHRFPIVEGIPVLIDEGASVFSIADFEHRAATYFKPVGGVARLAKALVPEIGVNLHTADNYRRLKDLLLAREPAPRILILGGSILGEGVDHLLDERFVVVDSDVAFGPRTKLICDAHTIPFADGSFDCVIAQAVLEHVADPQRVADEVFRVLKPAGYVYAETPFMQQVHGGCYDFTRFTYLGHRRLFRRFDQVAAGAAGGPGMALAWSYRYFLLSIVRGAAWRNVVKALSAATSFFLKYADRWVADSPAGLDAASGFYFLGTKSDRILSDRDLLKLYPRET